MASVLPPLDGSLPTLIEYIDFNTKHNGSKPWVLFPSAEAPSSKLASLSFADLCNASHIAAHIFRPKREGPEDRIVAVVLNTDTALYGAAMLGLMRAGFVPYPMSPRNSPQGISHMLKATSCTRVLAHSLTMPLVEQAQNELRTDGIILQIDDLPSLRELFPRLADPHIEPEQAPMYPPPLKPPVLEDLGMMIHSSGSTGFPKSIPLFHRRILQWMRHNVFGSPRGPPVRFAGMGLPTFHAMGFLLQYPLPPTVPHPQNILEVARMAECTALVVLPSFLEAWSHSQEAIDFLKTLEVVVYSGGPLSTVVGNKLIAAGVPIFGAYGGTETGNPSQQWTKIPRSERVGNPDWEWIRISEIATVKWEPQGDGSYELIVCENKDYTLGAYNVPGQKAFATSDLFVPHPTKEGLWRIVGRTDDVITLSTGEKIVPLPQEGTVAASPLVAGCVMFGREHEQAGILIEPIQEFSVAPGDDAALAVFRNKIWPTIEQANAVAPAFARIFKEMILLADPARPLPRSAKGAVVRKMTIIQYADDIAKLYEAIEESSNAKGIDPPMSWSLEDVSPWLLAHAKALVEKEDLCVTNDLFAQGFDSLSATFLRNRIVGALRSSTQDAQSAVTGISSNFIFEHSSIQRLALAISSLVRAGEGAPVSSAGVAADDIQALVDKYTAGMPVMTVGKALGVAGLPVVLLTGTTGNIGSHILAQLLSDERVGRVYALNRTSADPNGRLKSAFEARGLPTDLLHKEKLTSLTGDVSQAQFGLVQEQYDEVMSSVTHIIHNAWSVSFNLPLRAFEDQIAGVRKLVDLSAATNRTIRLLVTSSIGVADGWRSARGPVPESSLSDPSSATSSGYSASKYVVEQILDVASKRGLPATAVRMGQACGPRSTGAWGTTEWLPMMIKSSIALGYLPSLTGPVSWMPLDAIGQIYSDWVTSSADLPPLVNVVHPRPTTWDVVFRGVRDELGIPLPLVPLDQWVSKLDDIAGRASEKDVIDIPALGLSDFFRHLASTDAGVLGLNFDTTRLLESAPTARELQPLSEEHAHMWVRYWRSVGFLTT